MANARYGHPPPPKNSATKYAHVPKNPRTSRDLSEIAKPPSWSGGMLAALGLREAHPPQRSNQTSNQENRPKWQRLIANIKASYFLKLDPSGGIVKPISPAGDLR